MGRLAFGDLELAASFLRAVYDLIRAIWEPVLYCHLYGRFINAWRGIKLMASALDIRTYYMILTLMRKNPNAIFTQPLTRITE